MPFSILLNILKMLKLFAFIGLLLGVGLPGCGYRYYTGPLQPVEMQQESMSIADDGTVTFTQDRLEVSLKPMTDEELNRQLAGGFQGDPESVSPYKSANPYTLDGAPSEENPRENSRFTVFRLSVKNYTYPKVRIDPAGIVLRSANRREYWSLGFGQLDTYYRAYAIGYRGNEYRLYQERSDLLQRTLFKNEDIFSGQEAEGFVVFPPLDPDVNAIEVLVQDAVLRFDFRNEPVETVDIPYRFTRDIGRIYKDGRTVPGETVSF